jgi:hypothetical protein
MIQSSTANEFSDGRVTRKTTQRGECPTTRESFVRWIVFIHNKINEKLEKPTVSMNEFYIKYYEAYKPNDVKLKEYYKWKKQIIYAGVLLFSIGFIYYLYDK